MNHQLIQNQKMKNKKWPKHEENHHFYSSIELYNYFQKLTSQ